MWEACFIFTFLRLSFCNEYSDKRCLTFQWFRRELDQEPHILPCFSFSGIVWLSAFFRRQESRLKSDNKTTAAVKANLNIFFSFLFQHGTECSCCIFYLCWIKVWWEVNCFGCKYFWWGYLRAMIFYSWFLDVITFENAVFIDAIVNYRINFYNIDLISSSQLPFCCCFSIV